MPFKLFFILLLFVSLISAHKTRVNKIIKIMSHAYVDLLSDQNGQFTQFQNKFNDSFDG